MKPETLDLAAKACVYLIDASSAIHNDTTETVAANDHVALIRHYDQVRKLTDQIKDAREALDAMEKQLSREYVPDAMRARHIKTITIDGVGRVSLSTRWSCSMLDKPLGLEWLRREGHGGVIQETVNSNTLAALAKDMSTTYDFELPPDIFKTSTMTVTSITKV